jgi:hypothetical protein
VILSRVASSSLCFVPTQAFIQLATDTGKICDNSLLNKNPLCLHYKTRLRLE